MNDLERLRTTLLALPETTEETPFGPEVLVYKVAGKMFATMTPDEVPVRMNLKCDPDRSVLLREEYESIRPGWHMNKRHWNTVHVDGSFPDRLFIELIDHSYDLVVQGLPRKLRDQFR